ncbi:hypothetical protein LBMAG42_20160 [Deltaproteobacteria bacterium]|nr:hypothetical protein LBMAG42_20160 [Deltaproteobacteria bacterium]
MAQVQQMLLVWRDGDSDAHRAAGERGAVLALTTQIQHALPWLPSLYSPDDRKDGAQEVLVHLVGPKPGVDMRAIARENKHPRAYRERLIVNKAKDLDRAHWRRVRRECAAAHRISRASAREFARVPCGALRSAVTPGDIETEDLERVPTHELLHRARCWETLRGHVARLRGVERRVLTAAYLGFDPSGDFQALSTALGIDIDTVHRRWDDVIDPDDYAQLARLLKGSQASEVDAKSVKTTVKRGRADLQKMYGKSQ